MPVVGRRDHDGIDVFPLEQLAEVAVRFTALVSVLAPLIRVSPLDDLSGRIPTFGDAIPSDDLCTFVEGGVCVPLLVE